MRLPRLKPTGPGLAALGIAYASVFLGGCLACETYEIHIRTDPGSSVHRVTVVFHHVESDQDSVLDQRNDFNELLMLVTSDQYLVQCVRENKAYVRDRRLFLADGVLNASEEVLDPEAVKADEFLLSFPGNGDSVAVEIGQDDTLLATNGLLRGGRTLVWPDSPAEHWAKLHTSNYDGKSGFVDLYNDWVRRGQPTWTASDCTD